jgi:hypothetical protein
MFIVASSCAFAKKCLNLKKIGYEISNAQMLYIKVNVKVRVKLEGLLLQQN